MLTIAVSKLLRTTLYVFFFSVLNDLPSGSVGDVQNLQNEEQCYPLQEMMTFKLSSLQVVPFSVLWLDLNYFWL